MKKLVVAMMLSLLLSLSFLAGADDTASLRMAHGELLVAFESGNLDTLELMISESGFGFFRAGQQLAKLQSRSDVRRIFEPLWTDAAAFARTPTDSFFQVVGDTGIVCMTASARLIKNKSTTQFSRLTYVYARQNERWKLISWHVSDTPLK
jgi:hypothetical protein